MDENESINYDTTNTDCVKPEEDEDEEEEEVVQIVDDTVPFSIPSPKMILCGALDLMVWTLIALLLYTITAIHIASNNTTETTVLGQYNVGLLFSRIAAPTFPLALFVYAAVRLIHPWQDRKPIFDIIHRTLSAPFPSVTFRDGVIGDVLTSTVRPLQDIAFTIFYILFGIRGWWSNQYYQHPIVSTSPSDHLSAFSNQNFVNTLDANVPIMEQSWMVHTIVLPACIVSPLLWRFLQNMRQTYDYQQRWPYLGNAGKYFCAAAVAMTGVYHPHVRKSTVWLSCFVLATLYQVRTNFEFTVSFNFFWMYMNEYKADSEATILATLYVFT